MQKKEIEARIGIILSLTETPVRVMLQHEKEPSEIFIEKMTPEKWWCLLVQKNVGESCVFKSYKVGKKLKVVPFIECEETNIPEEAHMLLEIITSSQKRRHEIYNLLTSLVPKYNEARKKIISLIDLGDKKSRYQKSSLTKQRNNRKKLENKINKCRHIIAECEMAITDLTIKLKRM